MLSLTRQHDGGEFLQETETTFAQNEAANNLIYGLALRLAADPARYRQAPFTQPPFLATVRESDSSALVCAALMTPPFRLVLYAEPTESSAVSGAAFDLLIGELREGGWPAPGVTAEAWAAPLFAERWHALTGEKYSVEVQMRCYELRAVEWQARPPGTMRAATAEDETLIWQWYCDFTREAIPGDPLPPFGSIQRSVAEGNVYLWDDQGPVSLAARGRRLPHGYSVGPVYTPPALRGRGYAGTLVAALSQAILDAGALFCTLFTDLANPISNRIYERLGYQPVCDFTEYTFHVVDI